MIAVFDLGGYTLLDPWFLLAAPLFLLAGWRRAATRRAALPTASASLFVGLPRTLRQRVAWVPLLVKVLAGLCLALALARPVQRDVMPLREDGIDIVLVVDTSSSMLQGDMRDGDDSYRRMDAARERAMEFAAARVHDRVGLVAFGRYAELRCPPTLDEVALAAFLRVLDTQPRGSEFDATAIGTALTKAVQVLEKSTAKSKVVILLSDGQNNVDDIDPIDAAKLAKDKGVRVHTIGLGHGVPSVFGFQELSFDELKEIAETTGGLFFAARSDSDLEKVYERIDEMETSEREDPRYRTVDHFEWPLGIGLMLMLLAILFEALIVRRVP
ncbi:MAG: Ca-activated chloride channel family protein [Planctomycetota bacterium]|jgi:Ca-activated chloride channel family protein